MNRKHTMLALFVVAALCFITTALTTEHAISAGVLGVLLGYCAGTYFPANDDEE